MLQSGEEFNPTGGKYDTQLLNGIGKYVRRVESAIPQRKAKKR